MTSGEEHPLSLIQHEFIFPGTEKKHPPATSGREWAYLKVTTHEFQENRPHPVGPQGATLPDEKQSGHEDADADQAGTRKGNAQPDNKDYSSAKDADADQASTRKGNFQPGPEDGQK